MSTAPRPGDWVDPEAPGPAPWSTQQGIVKFIEFPVRVPQMSRRAFHLYWQRHHSPHVMNCTGFSQFMRKYVTTHAYPEPVDILPAHYVPVDAFEGAAEVWLASLDEAIAWLSHPLYAELIQPDEPRFIDPSGAVEILIAREERVLRADSDLAESGLVKVHALYRRTEALAPTEFHGRLSEAAHGIVMDDDPVGLLRNMTISHRLPEPQPEGFPIAPIDAIAEFWFDDPAQARRFYSSAAFERFARAERPLIADGRARAVVGVAHVVHDEYSFQPTVMQPQAFAWRLR